MTYISIDTNKKQAKLFLEYVKTLSFVTVHQEPNETKKKAIDEVKNSQSKKHKTAKDLIAFLISKMFTLHTTKQFQKDYKLCIKRNLNLKLINSTFEMLEKTGSLPCTHSLASCE